MNFSTEIELISRKRRISWAEITQLDSLKVFLHPLLTLIYTTGGNDQGPIDGWKATRNKVKNRKSLTEQRLELEYLFFY